MHISPSLFDLTLTLALSVLILFDIFVDLMLRRTLCLFSILSTCFLFVLIASIVIICKSLWIKVSVND